jgi:DNA-binding GntR family transcriptional regulator
MTIDVEGPDPIYQQVARIIRERIESGQIQPNRPVPSVVQLVQEFGIARGTAIKVLDLLRADGLVRTVPGRGTFVVEQAEE